MQECRGMAEQKTKRVKTQSIVLQNPENYPDEQSWFNAMVLKGKHERFVVTNVLVTPALAVVMLASNEENRSVSDSYVAMYAQDMQAGRWLLNGENLKVSKDGLLNDG